MGQGRRIFHCVLVGCCALGHMETSDTAKMGSVSRATSSRTQPAPALAGLKLRSGTQLVAKVLQTDQSEASSEEKQNSEGEEATPAFVQKILAEMRSTVEGAIAPLVGQINATEKVVQDVFIEVKGMAVVVEGVQKEVEDLVKFRKEAMEELVTNKMLRGGLKQRLDGAEFVVGEMKQRIEALEKQAMMLAEQNKKLMSNLAEVQKGPVSWADAVSGGGGATHSAALSSGAPMHITAEEKQTFTITGVPGDETGKPLADKIAQIISENLKDMSGEPIVVDIVDARRLRVPPKDGKPKVDKAMFRVHSAFDAEAIRKARSDLRKKPGSDIYINDELTKAELQRKQQLSTTFADRIRKAKAMQAEKKCSLVRWNRAQLLMREGADEKWTEVRMSDAPKSNSPRKGVPFGGPDTEMDQA